MSVELSLAEQDVEYLNEEARNALESAIRNYADDVLDEAMRLEATASGSDATPQVTSGMIEDADLVLRKGYRKPRKSRWRKAGQLIATGAGVLAGVLADLHFLQQPPYLILFIIVASTTVTLTVILTWIE